MAKSNRKSSSKTASAVSTTKRGVIGAFIDDEAYNRLEVHLDQMKELANLVIPENTDVRQGGTLTVLNLLVEKTGMVGEIIRAGYGRYEPPRKRSRK